MYVYRRPKKIQVLKINRIDWKGRKQNNHENSKPNIHYKQLIKSMKYNPLSQQRRNTPQRGDI